MKKKHFQTKNKLRKALSGRATSCDANVNTYVSGECERKSRPRYSQQCNAVFPNLFWFAEPLSSIEVTWWHPYMVYWE